MIDIIKYKSTIIAIAHTLNTKINIKLINKKISLVSLPFHLTPRIFNENNGISDTINKPNKQIKPIITKGLNKKEVSQPASAEP